MSEIIKTLTNLGDSGQDDYANGWAEYARVQLYEQGVSKKYIASTSAEYILAKMVTDLVEDGDLSSTTLSMIATLRTNHPHSEDESEGS